MGALELKSVAKRPNPFSLYDWLKRTAKFGKLIQSHQIPLSCGTAAVRKTVRDILSEDADNWDPLGIQTHRDSL